MGLNRYGAGDLDGAIFLWEEALAVDPENAQASSYIDYVRLNFDILSGEPSLEEPADAPYAIEEEPEYQIEVGPGDAALPLAAQIMSLDPVDEGWFADEETHDAVTAYRGDPNVAADSDAGTLDAPLQMESDAPIEMEADEPPERDAHAPRVMEADEPLEMEADEPSEMETNQPIEMEMEADEPPDPAVDFEQKTRKFHGDVQKTAEPILPTPDDLDADYGTAGPTTGFFRGDELSSGQTMGYFREDESTSYQPQGREAEPPPKPRADLEVDEFSDEPETEAFQPQGTPLGFSNLETEIRKRDFGFVQPTAAPSAVPPATISLGSARTEDRVAFETTQEHDPFGGNAANESADDLLDSLPTPRPMGSEPESGEILLSASPTLNFPDVSRGPGASQPLPLGDLRAHANSPMLSAPTRELGLRPGGRPLANHDDDDAPTGQSDVRAIRAAATRNDGTLSRDRGEGTQHDIVLQFDPIAAAAAQILEDIDAEAPVGESQEDQTRRRITRLLEKAGDWSESGELDKAVSAVDLALSEDASSALAQKLITRNKDTIMSLFQAFLGDLDRTPQLTKPLHELGKEPISPRAAFLLSRIDGMLTIDELLDVSGMPRLEAYRHLCQLVLRGILR